MLDVQDVDIGKHASPDQGGYDDADIKDTPIEGFVIISRFPGDLQVYQAEQTNGQVGEKKDQGSKRLPGVKTIGADHDDG